MLKQLSALEYVYQPGWIGVKKVSATISICERRRRSLVQISGWPDTFGSVCHKLQTMLGCEIPGNLRKAVTYGESTIFRVGPERLWLTGPEKNEILLRLDESMLDNNVLVTEIDHSRTVLRISGPDSKELLNRGLPIDLHESLFPVNSFVQSMIHHIPVLVHFVENREEPIFDVYITREYAVTFWEWLIDVAKPFGCQINDTD